nr:zinc knuckle CX2CX4HX4C [Tanacetum cinerariifolium]
ESGKEVVKDRIDYVNDEIYKNAEVSGDIEKNHDKVNGDMGMRMDKGISALASRLKRPIKIDQVTAEMCKNGVGRLGYARFLIKINTEDEFLDKIEINYLDKRRKVKSTKWNMGKDNVEKLKKSANKYVVLLENDNHIAKDPFIDKRLIVDKFIKKKIQPNCNETKDWTYDMIQYFKYQWKAIEVIEEEDSEEEDVFDSHNQAVNSLIIDEVVVNGHSCGISQ